MELLIFIKQIPLPILLLVIVFMVVVTLAMAFQYLKQKGLDGIRTDVYQLILVAEYTYKESGQGRQKLKWVVSQARRLLPNWLQLFITEDTLEKIIDMWFAGIKDLLDDGKVNGTDRTEQEE